MTGIRAFTFAYRPTDEFRVLCPDRERKNKVVEAEIETVEIFLGLKIPCIGAENGYN